MTGLRLQLLLRLALVIIIAYVPLFFAIAQVTRVTARAYREDGARSLGRAIAAHVADIESDKPGELTRTMAAHVGPGGALGIVVSGADGTTTARVGEVSDLPAPTLPYGEHAHALDTAAGRVLDVELPTTKGSNVIVRIRAEDDPARTAQLVRGIALYMSVFAFALLVFAYIVLTRAIVRPIEQLARAADRVASGARELELPTAGAREVAELGASVRSMTGSLLREEHALRAKVDELTATTKRLGETREQLAGSEHMASVGRLAAGVAHEIGNPIAAIMGMHDLLDDAPDDVRTDFLRRMRKETERINVVVRDLLDYARPEESVVSIRPSFAFVPDVIDDTLALVRPQKDFKSVTTHLEIDASLRVGVSPQRLTQVLLNLLLNAGAALSAQCEGTIVIRAKRDGTTARIEVEDDGPGVPKELVERIFDPFVTTKDVGAGTGLGLSVCRGIVEGATGTLRLDTTYTEGARFIVTIPIA